MNTGKLSPQEAQLPQRLAFVPNDSFALEVMVSSGHPRK
jgi:hypothetical protein